MSLFHCFSSLKSAVLFFSIFFLFSCEQEKKTTFPIEEKTLSNSQDTLKLEIPRLVRGVYGDLVISPEQLKSDEQSHFLRDILEGLVIYDSKGNIIPAVAESWSTEDNKTWLFTLRENARWSNGTPVTAEDFVQSWRKLATSSNPIKNYFAFLTLEQAQDVLNEKVSVEQLGVKALSPKQLQIRLEKATPYLPTMLAHPSLLPQYLPPHQGFVTNGAYYVKDQKGDVIHLEQNPYYWQKEGIVFPKVDYKKVTPTQLLSDIDLFIDVQKTSENVQYFPKLCMYYYEFNFNDPVLSQSAVRKSLTFLASARDLVRDDMSYIATNEFLPKSMLGEKESMWSPVLVEQLLQQNGFTEKSPLKIRLTFEQEGVHNKIAQRLIQMWSQSDLIRVELDPVSWSALLEKRAKGDFQIIRSGWCADYNDPSAFLTNFYSKSPDNKSGYHNQKVDHSLEQTLQSSDLQVRTELYQQIIQQLQQDNVVLPIFQYTTPIYLSPSLSGVEKSNPTNVIYSKDLRRSH